MRRLFRGGGLLFLGVVVTLLVLQSWARWVDDELRRAPIRIEREEATLRLWNNGVYDKVVTHLVSNGNEAVLPHLVLLRNHQGEKAIELGGLDWRDIDGARVPGPKAQDPIVAVVVDAEVQMR